MGVYFANTGNEPLAGPNLTNRDFLLINRPKLIAPLKENTMKSIENNILIPVSAKKRSSAQRAVYSDMRSDLQNTHRNAYRYISLFMRKSVFFADTGMSN